MEIEERIKKVEERVEIREGKIEELKQANREDEERIRKLYVRQDINANGERKDILDREKKASI